MFSYETTVVTPILWRHFMTSLSICRYLPTPMTQSLSPNLNPDRRTSISASPRWRQLATADVIWYLSTTSLKTLTFSSSVKSAYVSNTICRRDLTKACSTLSPAARSRPRSRQIRACHPFVTRVYLLDLCLWWHRIHGVFPLSNTLIFHTNLAVAVGIYCARWTATEVSLFDPNWGRFAPKWNKSGTF